MTATFVFNDGKKLVKTLKGGIYKEEFSGRTIESIKKKANKFASSIGCTAMLYEN